MPKSSSVPASSRPKASDHHKSMRVKESLPNPKEIVLVDDVITRGATILGAANRIAEAFPNSVIRVFAAMRTISNPDEFTSFLDPCTGTIELSGDGTLRKP